MKRVSPTGQAILRVLEVAPATISNNELSHRTHRHSRTIQKGLRELSASGLISITHIRPTEPGDVGRIIEVKAQAKEMAQ